MIPKPRGVWLLIKIGSKCGMLLGSPERTRYPLVLLLNGNYGDEVIPFSLSLKPYWFSMYSWCRWDLLRVPVKYKELDRNYLRNLASKNCEMVGTFIHKNTEALIQNLNRFYLTCNICIYHLCLLYLHMCPFIFYL
jgi:hypothetical protein